MFHSFCASSAGNKDYFTGGINGIRRFVSARQNYVIKREINQSTSMKKKKYAPSMTINNIAQQVLKNKGNREGAYAKKAEH